MLAQRPGPRPQGWLTRRIGEFATECKQRAGCRTDLPVLSVTKHYGIVRSDQYFSKRVHGKNTSSYKVIHPGQFAYATIHLNEGSIGKLRGSTPGIVSPMYTVFDVHDDIESDYLFAVLKSPRSLRVYEKITQGTVNRRGGISFRTLSGLVLHHPPLPEQRKIAAILSSVNDAIEQTQAVIDQVQVVKRGLMQELLSRGLPGRHTRFQQTEIGEIPRDWVVDRVGNLGRQDRPAVKAGPFGSSLKKSYYVSEGYRVYGQEQVLAGDLSMGDYYIDQERFELLGSCRVSAGDVLMSLVGTFGEALVVPRNAEPGIINPRLLRLSLDPQLVLPEFFCYWLQSDGTRKLLADAAQGGTMGVLNAGIVKNLRLGIPSLREQSSIIAVLEAVQQRLVAEIKVKNATAESKAALMSVLLPGELRVAPEKGASQRGDGSG